MNSNPDHVGGLDDGAIGDDAKVEIARLRAQVEELMRDRVTPAVVDAAGRAEEVAGHAIDYVSAKVEMVARNVRERPLTALVIAAGVGYFLGRVRR